MGKNVLTRKYRPQKLDELFDQEHVKKVLKNAILKGRIYHAYLFAGPRGVGKTSTARILAKSLNCVNGPTVEPCGKCKHCVEIANSTSIDVVEIDGASNRGINEIRNIKEHAIYLPVSARYKIFIIDEVHMLTQEAFNALLKILEEPPPHVVFIFATTAPHKVPRTILSRCQRYDFRLIPKDEIVKRLKWICENEGIEIDERSLDLIAIKAEGSFRDAESILEQVYSYSGRTISYEDVRELLGVIPLDVFIRFLDYLKKGDSSSIIKLIESIYEEGYDMIEFYNSLVDFVRDMILLKEKMDRRYISYPVDILEKVSHFSKDTLISILSILLEKESMIRFSHYPKYVIEVMVYDMLDVLQSKEQVRIVVEEKEEKKPPGKVTPDTVESAIREIGERFFVLKNIMDQSVINIDGDSIEIKVPESLYKPFLEISEKKGFVNLLRERCGRNIKVRITSFKEERKDVLELFKKHFDLEENDVKTNRKNSGDV